MPSRCGEQPLVRGSRSRRTARATPPSRRARRRAGPRTASAPSTRAASATRRSPVGPVRPRQAEDARADARLGRDEGQAEQRAHRHAPVANGDVADAVFALRGRRGWRSSPRPCRRSASGSPAQAWANSMRTTVGSWVRGPRRAPRGAGPSMAATAAPVVRTSRRASATTYSSRLCPLPPCPTSTRPVGATSSGDPQHERHVAATAYDGRRTLSDPPMDEVGRGIHAASVPTDREAGPRRPRGGR